jgi:hypothetical protein
MSIAEIQLLQQFKTQVTDHGAHACLPRELNHSWLPLVRQSTQALLDCEETGGAIAIAALLTLLDGKGISLAKTIEDDAVLQSICLDYCIELNLETAHRGTEMKYQPATLENIFMKRDVDVWRDGNTH